MEQIISDAIAFIRAAFAGDSSGHDYYHSMRVCQTALLIAKREHADAGIVALAALLHDVDDRKLSPQTHAHKDNAVRFLTEHGVSEESIRRICLIIDEVSFSGSDSVRPSTLEGQCVQDADRLDALGAIGIARTFAYGGSHGRAMYDPDDPPMLNMNRAEYEKRLSSSLNHFYEKLFLLKDMMSTDYGRKIAEKRDIYMREFAARFMAEWDGADIDL